jgi:hypothetical protein
MDNLYTDGYWKHYQSGESYAVKTQAGSVVQAAGPLHYSERTKENLAEWNFNSAPDLVDELNEHGEDYVEAEPYNS